MNPGLRRLHSFGIKYSPLLILAAVWELLPVFGIVSADSLPEIGSILKSLFFLVTDGEIIRHTWVSLFRAFTGLGLAIVFGIVAGTTMAWFAPVRITVNPIIQMFYPMPKSALIPVVIIWFGIGDASKIVLVFLGCMLPMVVSTFNGARGVDRETIWSARSMGTGRVEMIWKILLPSAMPEILNGARTALALCFALLVSAELLISREGLGFLIGTLGEAGENASMFAVIFIFAVIGYVADRLYLLFRRRTLSWME
jgi:NitT/TauT family transport system permease protein